MSFIQVDLLGWIPDEVKRRILDSLVDFVSKQAEKILGDEIGEAIKKLRSDTAFQDAFDEGVERATNRFIQEYVHQDEDLVMAIASDENFWRAKSVRQALLAMIQHPGRWLDEEREALTRHFDDVLPHRINRERVNRAVAFFLRCLAEELWHLPQLQPIYELQLQRVTAERATEMVQELRGMRADVREALVTLVQGLAEQQKSLVPGAHPALLESPKVYHNLPQPDYVRFVGRKEELARIRELLSPHSRAWVIVIDGIGGIGKSALALEVAHRYLREFDKLPEEERFQAIIWTSAKAATLTADGIAPRQQITRTLDDIYTTISVALEREDITRARPEEQDNLVRHALTQQRTLLIIDNLETIDDERVNAFLRELPAPTKCIVTTRHRIDVAYPIRLTGMPRKDALTLIAQECEKKGVTLTDEQADLLYRRTGGVPLAIVWSVAQMGYGYDVEAVLRRLGTPTSDIARYCFEGAIEHIRGRSAHKLLMALSLFATDASREALGYVADLPALDRDEGLVELEKLSLVNKLRDRFKLLPLTKTYALNEMAADPHSRRDMEIRWIQYLKRFCGIVESEYYWRRLGHPSLEEGPNILAAVDWAYSQGTAADVFALTQGACWYLEVVGRWAEEFEYAQKAADLARSINAHLAVARFLGLAGWIAQQRGEYSRADEMFQEALDRYRLANSREGECIALQWLAIVPRKTGRFKIAQELCDAAWRIAEELQSGDLKALVNTQRGKLARDMGDWPAAWEYFASVRDWFEARAEATPRDETLAVGTWGHLGLVAYHLGKYEEAKALCLRGLEFFEREGPKGYVATLKYRLALIEDALGHLEQARKYVEEALFWFERLGMRPDLMKAQQLRAQIDQKLAATSRKVGTDGQSC